MRSLARFLYGLVISAKLQQDNEDSSINATFSAHNANNLPSVMNLGNSN